MSVTVTNGASGPEYVDRSPGTGVMSDDEIFARRDKLYELICACDVPAIRDFFSEPPAKEVMDEIVDKVLRYVMTHCKADGGPGKDSVDVLKALLEYLPYEALNGCDDVGMNPLMYAAQENRAELARVLVDTGASRWWADHHGRTALFYAAISDAVDVIKVLLGFESSRGIDARSDEGSTAFGTAVSHGSLAAAEALLEKGANINATNNLGETPLIRSVTGEANRKKLVSGDTSVVQWLIDKHARLDDTDRYGRTALHQAVVNNDVPVARILLDAGASYTIKDGAGKDAAALAAVQGDEMQNLFMQYTRSR